MTDIEALRREFEAACQNLPLRTYTLHNEPMKWDGEHSQYHYCTTQYLFVGFCAGRKASQVEIDIEALADRIAESLTSAYVCTRVWSAWSVGTMTEDDFEPADESELPGEIAEKVIEFIGGKSHVGVDLAAGESRTVTEEFESGNPVDDAIERYRNSSEFANSSPEECIGDLLTIAADYDRLKAERDTWQSLDGINWHERAKRAEAEIDRLKAEIREAVARMPESCRVIVREGGGAENPAASLAVSISNMNDELRRLRDIVRQFRTEAHDQQLINDSEYESLAGDGESVARLRVYDDMRIEIERLKAKLSRYSVSAGMADQYKCEALACRKALGFAEDSDDVSPSDLTAKIERLQFIVDRIPKFADGSPALPGDEAWHSWYEFSGRVTYRDAGCAEHLYVGFGPDAGRGILKPLSECYPTREAMEKANEG